MHNIAQDTDLLANPMMQNYAHNLTLDRLLLRNRPTTQSWGRPPLTYVSEWQRFLINMFFLASFEKEIAKHLLGRPFECLHSSSAIDQVILHNKIVGVDNLNT